MYPGNRDVMLGGFQKHVRSFVVQPRMPNPIPITLNPIHIPSLIPCLVFIIQTSTFFCSVFPIYKKKYFLVLFPLVLFSHSKLAKIYYSWVVGSNPMWKFKKKNKMAEQIQRKIYFNMTTSCTAWILCLDLSVCKIVKSKFKALYGDLITPERVFQNIDLLKWLIHNIESVSTYTKAVHTALGR